jgi:glutamate-5-semialdehyde dehydrogenase
METSLVIDPTVRDLATRAKEAALALATLRSEEKNTFLLNLAAALESAPVNADVLRANEADLAAGAAGGLSSAMLDRLRLDTGRLSAMAQGVREVAALPDPVGALLEERAHAKGFTIRKRRVPIGVVGVVYESRPNVTVDCAVLCLKSGNATILRGGKEALHTNRALAAVITEALIASGLPRDAIQLVPTTDREALRALLQMDDCIHCFIPRGGEGLIRFVAENARMPVIKHYKGVCNLFLDETAEAEMATAITVNAKCQRPSVCNAIENLVVHAAAAPHLLPRVAKALVAEGVELRADIPAREVLAAAGIDAQAASESDFHEEYLEKILAIKTVESLEEAIRFINTYGSAHSDAIVTENADHAQAFLNGVDSAAVYWNVSTRFTDGYEFGLGAEIGISTDKLHARGPMGLTELTSYKYEITGHGEIR